MENLGTPRMETGEVGIEGIKLDYDSRSDTLVLLMGFRELYSDESVRARLFAQLEQQALSRVDRKRRHPEMGLWQIFVLAAAGKALNRSLDHVLDLANHHISVRSFLGHPSIHDDHHYEYRTVAWNLKLIDPEFVAGLCPAIMKQGREGMKRERKAGKEAAAAARAERAKKLKLLRERAEKSDRIAAEIEASQLKLSFDRD